jgi:hypothetical protein
LKAFVPVLVFVVAACCGPLHRAPEVLPRPGHEMSIMAPDNVEAVVQLDSAVRDFLMWVQGVAQTEWVFCLMGAFDAGKPTVITVLPTRNHSQTRTSTHYEECPAYVFAAYLGTAHNHVDGPCVFSAVDDQSFRRDARAWIEVLTCPGRIVARSKGK